MPTKFVRKVNRLSFKKIYNTNNSFFITICVEDRICCLSEISNEKVRLTPAGYIVQESWLSMENLINDIQLEDFVIMPNHFHSIITFLDTPTFKSSGKIIDLSQIIAIFKSKTTNLIRRGMPLASQNNINQKTWQASHAATLDNIPNFQWQKSFYDHVIRDEKDLQRIREYIQKNPAKWQLDILNPQNEEKYKEWLMAKNTKHD